MSGSSWADRAQSLEKMAGDGSLNKGLIADDGECLDWSDDEGAAGDRASFQDSELGAGARPEDDKSLCVALCTVALAIPALVGSWCWPILVGAMFAVAASNVNGGLVAFFHGVQVAVMLALMTNILQFASWKVKKRKGTHWQRKGPLWLIGFSSIMVLTQPVCMLVIGSWENMPNFFFDGGDMGATCRANADCHSGSCMAGSNGTSALLNDYWTQVGCTGPYDIASKYLKYNITTNAEPDGSLMGATDIINNFKEICSKKANPLHASCNRFDNECGTNSDIKCSRYSTPNAHKCVQGGRLATFDTSTCACTLLDEKQEKKCDCTCAMDSNALVPNTGIGLFIQIFCTYGGFALMFTGVFQATNLHKKIAAQWRQLRKGF